MYNGFKELDTGKMYARKKFMKLIFHGMEKDEYIRVYQSKKYIHEEEELNYKNVKFFNDIDDLNTYTETKKYGINTYFNLATTDGEAGQENNLKYRYCLAWDFDKKDDPNLDVKEILLRFKALNLWYHCIVSSGHGFHVYMIIDKTDDLQKVEDVTKVIGNKLKADPNAMLKTQILRVPLTFNVKEKKNRQVNIVHMFEKESVRPYDINDLHNRFCNKKTDDRTIKYALNKSKFPPCIVNMLKGVDQGDRNFTMRRIISFLKVYKYSQSEGYHITKEWNMKNNPPINDSEFEYQFKYIWEKYNYFGCKTDDQGIQTMIDKYCNKADCKSKSKDDILFVEGETIAMEYKLCDNLKRPTKNRFQIKGNHLLIISVLKNNSNQLYSNQLIERLTYKGVCCISNRKLSDIINELSEHGYINIVKGNKRKSEKDLYILNDIKSDDMTQFNLSYFAVLGVIKKNITPEDFKVYCFMRYRLSKGLNVTQEIIGDELKLSQPSISVHIKNLVREKYLEVFTSNNGNIHANNFYKINL